MKNNTSIIALLLKKISIASICLCLFSCGFITNDTKAQKTTDTPKEETSIEKEPYIVKPNYEHQKFKTLSTAFDKQKHRFEIDRCQFKYNDQAFFIGDSMEKLISVLGEPDDGKIESDDGAITTFFLKKLKLLLRFSNTDKKLTLFWITLSDDNKHDDTPYKIIKLRQIPYHLDMTLNEFIKLSDLEHDTTLKHGSAAFYIINEKECSNTKAIELEIGSHPSYNVIVSGGGHMTSTTTGDFRPEISNPIEKISVGHYK